MIEYGDLKDAIEEIVDEESIPTESWVDFSAVVEHQVALREPELVSHPDYDRVVRRVFEERRGERDWKEANRLQNQLTEALNGLETIKSPEDLLRQLNHVIPLLEFTLNKYRKRRDWLRRSLRG